MSSASCLVINTGSSSVKFAVFNNDTDTPHCWGQVSHLFSDKATLSFSTQDGTTDTPFPGADHNIGMEAILSALTEHNVMQNLLAVGHRVVHGGPQVSDAQFISPDVISLIEKYAEFAPLHNPANLAGIDACRRFNQSIPQVAVFDTAFHHGLSKVASSYAIPSAWQQQFGIRRFGFHGINHHYVAHRTTALLQQEGLSSVVSAHLGNGCSVCAIKDGRSVDTSMGFTPLEGLVMGTRCGDLDPGLFEYLCQKLNMNVASLTRQLNRESGLKGVSCVGSDMREILQARSQGNEQAALAIEIFCYRLAKYIASYVVPLNGIDMLVFTAGIGEHAPDIRTYTVDWLSALGFELDSTQNQSSAGGMRMISSTSSKPVYIIPANEEWMIARQTFQVLNQMGEH